jgi:hypothetical protein
MSEDVENRAKANICPWNGDFSHNPKSYFWLSFSLMLKNFTVNATKETEEIQALLEVEFVNL